MILQSRPEKKSAFSILFLSFNVFLLLVTTTQSGSAQMKPAGSEPASLVADSAILNAFNKYEVVAMPQGHGEQDLDAFILSLIRHPAFATKVNDIEIECGNSFYQPLLDRYIAGDDVPFTEVQKVWRKTTQPPCAASGFVEQFFPLVRAINKAPARKATSCVSWRSSS